VGVWGVHGRGCSGERGSPGRTAGEGKGVRTQGATRWIPKQTDPHAQPSAARSTSTPAHPSPPPPSPPHLHQQLRVLDGALEPVPRRDARQHQLPVISGCRGLCGPGVGSGWGKEEADGRKARVQIRGLASMKHIPTYPYPHPPTHAPKPQPRPESKPKPASQTHPNPNSNPPPKTHPHPDPPQTHPTPTPTR